MAQNRRDRPDAGQQPPPGTPEQNAAHQIRARVQRESRLIGRLLAANATALHDECQRLGLPHEGRTEGELRAALFTLHRRSPTG